jgi:hypothetical protein
MNIWIVTTGSSDVQLKTDEHWDDWYVRSPIKRKCDNLPFKPTQIIEDSDEPYRIAPRVLAKVYEEQKDEVWNCLEFPLLHQFATQLQGKAIDKIYLLVTDQTDKYSEERRGDARCPYWQDTCELQPIFERYFKEYFQQSSEDEEESVKVELIPLLLSTEQNEPGLDDWNHVLKIIQTEFSNTFSKIQLKPETVYVSHQAGTPAISSAVQFVSLATFGERVKFLVSNEYEKKPLEPIGSSEYLRGIQIQEAKALLKRYDYEGVKDLLSPYWKNPLNSLEQKISDLLEMAIQWNRAEFKDFGDLAKDKIEGAKERIDQPWSWWIGYESAYLAVVRLEQENTVEALFHSFRAIEGLICEWAEWRYKHHIFYKKDKKTDLESPLIHRSIITELPDYLKKKFDNKDKNKNQESVGLYSFSLYELLRQSRPEWQKDAHVWVVWDIAAKWRNQLFHQLLGLQEEEIYKVWATNKEGWETRVLGCLNFIAEPQPYPPSLKEASLMSQVHEELKEAIAQYEHTS